MCYHNMYGLLGKKLQHSFSREIHNYFGNSEYKLIETNNLKDFLENNSFKGLNVTIPYKTEIIPFLDELDVIARETNSVNTVINNDGKLIGYNTDYYGLKETLSFNNVEVCGRKILIIGNGSVSKTVTKLCNDLNAERIIKICRKTREKTDYLLLHYTDFLDSTIIINTTPVGMYPNNDDELLIDISKFNKLEFVIDLVYNPLRTKLLVESEKLNIKTINGLYMLVMQAKKAHELFFGIELPLNLVNKIYNKVYNNYLNYVFIGLPLSGKTKYANVIGEILSKITYDIDKYIENKHQKSIPIIFETEGEKSFRLYEKTAIQELYKLQNIAISTGGGLVENSKIMDLLKQNGIIIFLNKNPEIIAKKKIYGRPLLKDPKDIILLANNRIPMYRKHADITIDISKTTEEHINEIKEKINEYISR